MYYSEMAAASVPCATKYCTSEEDLFLMPLECNQKTHVDFSPRTTVTTPRMQIWLGASCNLLNGTLGPGMLVLPLAFSRTGLYLGTTVVLAFWCFSYLALLLLLEACARTHTSNLVYLGRLHSERMSKAVDWSVFLYFYGTCTSYLILVSGTLTTVLRTVHEAFAPPPGWDPEPVGTMLLIALTLAVILPLASCRSIEKLGAFSSVIVVLYGYVCYAVWSSTPKAPSMTQHQSPNGKGQLWSAHPPPIVPVRPTVKSSNHPKPYVLLHTFCPYSSSTLRTGPSCSRCQL